MKYEKSFWYRLMQFLMDAAEWITCIVFILVRLHGFFKS